MFNLPALTYLDCGAAGGPHSSIPRQLRGKVRFNLIGVEPDPVSFAQLRLGNRYSKLLTTAIGLHNGQAQLHICKDKYVSSILKPNLQEISKIAPLEAHRYSTTDSISVETKTLSTLLSQLPVQPDIIKLDIQGLEVNVLLDTILPPETSLLILEASDIPLYHNQATFIQLHSYLVSAGFSLLHTFYKPNLPCERDLIYLREPSTSDTLNNKYTSALALFSFCKYRSSSKILASCLGPVRSFFVFFLWSLQHLFSELCYLSYSLTRALWFILLKSRSLSK